MKILALDSSGLVASAAIVEAVHRTAYQRNLSMIQELHECAFRMASTAAHLYSLLRRFL